MARKPDPKPRELPMDIVAGNIAGLMQRRESHRWKSVSCWICTDKNMEHTHERPVLVYGGGSEYDMFIFRRDVGAACT